MDNQLRTLERLAKQDASYLPELVSLHQRIGGFDYLFAEAEWKEHPIHQYGWVPINLVSSTYYIDAFALDSRWVSRQWHHFLDDYAFRRKHGLVPIPTERLQGVQHNWDDRWHISFLRTPTMADVAFTRPDFHWVNNLGMQHLRIGTIMEGPGEFGNSPIIEALRLIYKMHVVADRTPLRVIRAEPAKLLGPDYLLMSGEWLRSEQIGITYTDGSFLAEHCQLPVGTLKAGGGDSPLIELM